MPSDLSNKQMLALGLAVVLAHGWAAWSLMREPTVAASAPEPAAVVVQLIDVATVAPTPPAVNETPLKPNKTPVKVALTSPVKPAPRPLVVSERESASDFSVQPAVPVPPVVQPTPAQQTSPAPIASVATPSATTPTSVAPVPNAAPATPVAPRQLSISEVRYAVKPPLVFPPLSESLGESGQVLLNVRVDERGRAVEVSVAKSSGFDRLDQAAMAWIKNVQFEPYKKDGVPMPFRVKAPVNYEL